MKTLLFLLTMCVALPARADYVSYSIGAHCVEDGVDTGAFDRNEARITRTTSAGKGRLICPVPRVRQVGQPNSKLLNAVVYTTDLNPTGDIACSLSIRDSYGTPTTWKTESTHGALGMQMLLIVVQINPTAPLSLECLMPTNGPKVPGQAQPFAAIHNYNVDM